MSNKDNEIIQKIKLPSKWDWSTLGVISNKPQYGWTTKANHTNGNLKLLRTTDITSGSVNWFTVPYCTEEPDDIEKYLVRDGDILISRAGSVGVSFLVHNPHPSVFASYLIRFRPKEPINSKYFYYYLKSPFYWAAIGASKSGIAVPNVNASKLSNVPIPIAPENQQKRIVSEIEKQFSRLDEAVVCLKRAKANLKRYKASVLKAAVEGKLTEEWRKQNPDVEPAEKLLERILKERRKKWEEAELKKMRAKGKEPKNDKWKKRYNEPTAPTIADLPSIPKLWTWATLPQLGELNRGKSKHRPRNDPKLYGGPYPFIQTGDVRHAVGLLTEYSQTYSDEGLKQSRLWPIRTLCITIAANIADTAILGLEACFPDSVVGFIPETEDIKVDFVEYFLRTAKENLEKFAPATAQKNINLTILNGVAIPVPPINEQVLIIQEIDKRLSIAERTEQELEFSLKRAEHLRQSILKKAFSGKLLAN